MSTNIQDGGEFQAALGRDVSVQPGRGHDGAAGVTDAVPDEIVSHVGVRDRVDWAKDRPGMLAYLRYAQTKSGRRPMDLAREFLSLRRGPGRLTWPEYVQYGVYDTARNSSDDQARFLTNTLHWPITHKCCDMSWQATTEDKWLCSYILARSGIRVPETLAMIDRSERLYPGTHKISTAEQLGDFMTSQDSLPLFGKENRGICSFGAFLAEEADSNSLRLKGQGLIDYGRCMDEFVGETPYLLQRLETNHGFFDRFAHTLATVRVCVLIDQGNVRIPFAVLKLPSRENVADSFWRPGNLACDLDVETGKILTARTKDALGTTDHEAHPETGAPMLGEVLPMWRPLLDLVRRCAPIFASVRYQSMDIAITPDEPVLIEINTGGGFDLPQFASGKGFLTDDVRAFFHNCGCEGF